MGLGALGFLPAANVASFGLFLSALWILASGITLLQVAANPYIARLGPDDKAVASTPVAGSPGASSRKRLIKG
jgi:FHS family L-fucose permease-like MFS transporter